MARKLTFTLHILAFVALVVACGSNPDPGPKCTTPRCCPACAVDAGGE